MPRIDRSTPAAVIREFRERWGLTQQDLALALGLGKNRLSDYETGVGAPAWMRFALVGYATVELRVPPEDLGWLAHPEPRGRSAAGRPAKSRTPAARAS